MGRPVRDSRGSSPNSRVDILAMEDGTPLQQPWKPRSCITYFNHRPLESPAMLYAASKQVIWKNQVFELSVLMIASESYTE